MIIILVPCIYCSSINKLPSSKLIFSSFVLFMASLKSCLYRGYVFKIAESHGNTKIIMNKSLNTIVRQTIILMQLA